MARPRAANHEAVTRADGAPYICTVARSATEWWLFVTANGWGQKVRKEEFGPWKSALHARHWKQRLYDDLQAAANVDGDAAAVLDRWTRERPWEV